jgi:hypothetical protein
LKNRSATKNAAVEDARPHHGDAAGMPVASLLPVTPCGRTEQDVTDGANVDGHSDQQKSAHVMLLSFGRPMDAGGAAPAQPHRLVEGGRIRTTNHKPLRDFRLNQRKDLQLISPQKPTHFGSFVATN